MILPGAALLDVNVLVALFDADHIHHELAHDWFADNREAGWATSPITENGLVRVLAHPRYGAAVTRVPELVERLSQFKDSGHHRFWPDSVWLGDSALFDAARTHGFGQVTDVYLLGLAHRHGGHLVTFDRSIPIGAVRGATAQTLTIIGPARDTPGWGVS